MKSIFSTLIGLLLLTVSTAQNTKIPQLVNFQAVARDPGGAIIANQPIQVQLTIHEGSAAGAAVYCARHKATTNAYGSFSIQLNRSTESIGCNGAPTAPFEDIPWLSGSKWMQIQYEHAPNAGFTDLGAMELTAVFYAFAARKAEEVTFISTAGAEQGNVLAYDAVTGKWKPTVPVGSGIAVVNQGAGITVTQNGNSVVVTNSGDTDGSDDLLNTTPAQGDVSGTFGALSVDRIKGRPLSATAPAAGQVLKWDGSQWTAQDDNAGSGGGAVNTAFPLTGNGAAGNPVTLTTSGVGTGQILKWNGTQWTAQNDNDSQSLTINGNQLSIANGNTVTLPGGSGGTQTLSVSGNQLSISNGNSIVLPGDNDSNPQNELQSLSVSGNQLSISSGNTVTLPTGGVQTLSLSGNQLSISNGNSVTLPTGGNSQWQNNGTKIYYSGGNVGIGTNDPSASLQVVNTSLSNSAILGIGSASSGAGVAGLGDNFTPIPTNKTGVYGSGLNGVMGIGNTKNTEGGIGLWGIGQGTNSIALFGQASGTNALAGYLQGDLRIDGAAGISTPAGAYRVVSGIAPEGYGLQSFFGPAGLNVGIGTTGNPNAGAISVFGPTSATFPSVLVYGQTDGDGAIEIGKANGSLLMNVGGSTSGAGFLGTFGLNDKVNVQLSNLANNPNNGYLAIKGSDGTTNKVGIYLDANGHGKVFVNNSSGSVGAEIGYMPNGTSFVSANVKNFRMVHPDDPTKEIWYASVEGPEAAAYERGTANLVNGVAQVTFADHFQTVANAQTMTVILTPLSADSKGMAVIEKTRTGFRVKELLGGSGSYQFDWEVKCVRKGYEGYQVVRPREEPGQPDRLPTERANMTRESGLPTQGLPAAAYSPLVKSKSDR